MSKESIWTGAVLKKTEGKIRYSVGYTYSRTFLKSMGVSMMKLLIQVTWFPANFDKPNDLVVTFNLFFLTAV